jgi:excinuclease UvrABC ATPase subunit
VRGYGPGRFSFNVKGGRCEHCEGDGVIKIEMNFLPPVYVTCEVCGGRRFNRETLATELQRRATGKSVYVLDEPTTGLHFEDVRKLLIVLNGLVDKGNTVIVIEHNLDVIKSADWIVDLGPEGGAGGGEVVAVGTPEQVAASTQSHTATFLREILSPALLAG